jgi:hypothetical protein
MELAVALGGAWAAVWHMSLFAIAPHHIRIGGKVGKSGVGFPPSGFGLRVRSVNFCNRL